MSPVEHYEDKDIRLEVWSLAEHLNESDEGAVNTIRKALYYCPREVIDTALERATAGLDAYITNKRDGSPRTLGGSFFVALKDELIGRGHIQAYKSVFCRQIGWKVPGLKKRVDPFPKELQTEGVRQVKTVVLGQPDRIETQGETVILHMVYTPYGTYSLPKGVPDPKPIRTFVTVYVGRKQFEKVKKQIDDHEDSLIVEGSITQVIDGILVVYATNITTKFTQRAKIEQQKSQAKEAGLSASPDTTIEVEAPATE